MWTSHQEEHPLRASLPPTPMWMGRCALGGWGDDDGEPPDPRKLAWEQKSHPMDSAMVEKWGVACELFGGCTHLPAMHRTAECQSDLAICESKLVIRRPL
jgi:hypothetical protein